MATKHGMYGTRTYKTWGDMVYRCKHNRGIYTNVSVCRRWRKFENFLKDMGARPEGKTIDRINGERGYSKNNCRWATNAEQAKNRKSTRLIEFNGKKLMMKEWALLLGVKRSTLSQRYYCYGWSTEKTFSYKKGGVS